MLVATVSDLRQFAVSLIVRELILIASGSNFLLTHSTWEYTIHARYAKYMKVCGSCGSFCGGSVVVSLVVVLGMAVLPLLCKRCGPTAFLMQGVVVWIFRNEEVGCFGGRKWEGRVDK